ncbi:Hypothetical protein FKW44_006570 [Caligus rogercresseyi]|uniref:Uncharacterized protein n=1 Tax=Caligus rogercresseyi TaxID=217165 RepID=A0A7T8KDJ5_CALRO|nr:Hypothetical protein FKW44_006570 [Caligus rogercresseyi]
MGFPPDSDPKPSRERLSSTLVNLEVKREPLTRLPRVGYPSQEDLIPEELRSLSIAVKQYFMEDRVVEDPEDKRMPQNESSAPAMTNPSGSTHPLGSLRP